MSLSIGAGRHLVDEGEIALRLDTRPSTLALRMLHRALALAGDPIGKRTYRVDLSEGTAVLHMHAVDENGDLVVTADGTDVVMQQVTVDIIGGTAT